MPGAMAIHKMTILFASLMTCAALASVDTCEGQTEQDTCLMQVAAVKKDMALDHHGAHAKMTNSTRDVTLERRAGQAAWCTHTDNGAVSVGGYSCGDWVGYEADCPNGYYDDYDF